MFEHEKGRAIVNVMDRKCQILKRINQRILTWSISSENFRQQDGARERSNVCFNTSPTWIVITSPRTVARENARVAFIPEWLPDVAGACHTALEDPVNLFRVYLILFQVINVIVKPTISRPTAWLTFIIRCIVFVCQNHDTPDLKRNFFQKI